MVSTGLQMIIDKGLIEHRVDNIDNKGLVNLFNIGDFSIKHCPVCGEIICNMEIPFGHCKR